MRLYTGIKRAAMVCGAAALCLAAATPFATAAASNYASFDFGSASVTVPAAGFPGGHIETNSTSPSAPSGASTFLNASTPFGQEFGSSQNRPYALLHLAQGRQPSTTTVSFDFPPAAGTWGFTLGDVDAENVHIDAFGPDGTQLPTSALGFQSTFNFCTGTPLPSTCKGTTGTDQPGWNNISGDLTGNVADTDGASAWFRPTAPISVLVFKATLNSGIPAYQLWIAGHDQPPPSPTLISESVPKPGTMPGEPINIVINPGPVTNVDIVEPPQHGTIQAHSNGTVTYTPAAGFVGTDVFTLKIFRPGGKVLVKTFEVRVGLPNTGPVVDLLGLAVLAVALLCAGLVLTLAVIRVDRAYWSASGDTIDP